MEFIELDKIVDYIDICEGDNIFVSSDVTKLAYLTLEKKGHVDLNGFIDSIIDKIGEKGTLIFPTYNWDFCKGICFDYNKTKCMTGALGTLALKRKDFIRTRHPIYSFAVWGKGKEALYEMDNTSSFGADSPFAYLKEHEFKNLFIDVTLQHSMTFVHYVEEQVGDLPYRYQKNFTGEYIDREGNSSIKTVSMLVRNLEKETCVTINPMEIIFENAGIERRYTINDIEFKFIDLAAAYELIEADILYNKSKCLCTYKGQD